MVAVPIFQSEQFVTGMDIFLKFVVPPAIVSVLLFPVVWAIIKAVDNGRGPPDSWFP